MPLPFANEPNYESQVIGWAKEAISEADNFLKAQKGFSNIQASIDAIWGDSASLRMSKLSSTSANYLGKITTDLAAGMTDVRPFMQYLTQNVNYEPIVDNFNKLGEHWWYNRSADMRLCDTIKYATVAGTGFQHMSWDPDIQDITATAEDPRDILPIRPTDNITLQTAAGVIIRRQRTVNYGRSRWPESKWDKIIADSDGSWATAARNSKMGRLLERATAGLSPFHDLLFGDKAQDNLPRVPTYDEYTMYLRDDRRHEGTVPLFIGDFTNEGRPRNNWSYIVYKGEPIYPNKRLIIFTNHGVLYDGPNQYWHGLYPLPKLTLDPYPWTWLGKGIVWDLLSLQAGLDKSLRVWDDHLEKIARPDVVADKNSVSKAALDKIDARRPGLKIMHNPLAGKGVQFVYPEALPNDFWKGLQFYIDTMNELSGVTSVQALMRLNQVPSSDTIEQIAERMSPSVRLRSRVIECFIREYATMLAYNFVQFYTMPRRLRIRGAKGITSADFDFDPRNMVPDFIGADYDDSGRLMRTSPRPRMQRAKEMMENISFHVTPGSLLAQSDVTERMTYIQLYRMGAMDIWTMLNKLKIPNIGEEPAGSILDRLAQQAQMGIEAQVSAVGRKATGQQQPKLKSSGAISESG